ncbi:TonB-dependent receptor [Prevotella sp. 10(H)]|uniref:SusC/RagA family TonB-linked outer membrane protein n=1 Tax=Prevotella sp. 10(H) TaxID=1158294 RepID=UPI001E45A9F0|nr:TonB-dependent receptor [Prevotella sp. 10(H)]
MMNLKSAHNIRLCLLLLCSLFYVGIQAQVRISGAVTDESNAPLIGATVQQKGTTNASMTDVDGKYDITVSDEDIALVFSYIGYEPQEIIPKGRRLINVNLEPAAKGLNEVIVVGYGTQKKISVTGAVAQISGEELIKAPASNLSAMLQGRLPGLVTRQTSGQPGYDGASLNVRGVGNGDGNTLVIVDGIARPFPSISPAEIESITLLKDAASAAVYGFNGSGGVILVTTKKGKAQKPTITLNSSIQLSTNTNFPEFLNGEDYMYWYNRAQQLDGVPDNNLRFSQDEINRIKNGDPYGVYANTDWFDELFRSAAPTYNNTLSLTGGSDRFSYYIGLGALNQQGAMKHTSFDRYNFRTNIDSKITNNLTASIGIGYRQSKTQEPAYGVSSILQHAMLMYPYLPRETYSGVPVGSLNSAGNGNQNPIALRDESGTKQNRHKRIESNISLKYDVPLVPGLSVKFTGAYDYFHQMVKTGVTPYKLAVYNQGNKTWNEEWSRVTSDGKAYVYQDYTDQYDYFLQSSAEYSRKFGKHDIKALFLYEYGRTKFTSMSAAKRGFPVLDILDLSKGDEVVPNSVQGAHNIAKRGGYVMRVNYDYDTKYLLELSGRIDGTTYLPGKNRWALFPGVSAGWRISEEPFFKENIKVIDNLKLRASFGQLGSQTGLGYGLSYMSMANLSDNPIAVIGNEPQRYLNIGSIANPDLKWQVTDNYNIGFETSFWKGLLGVELDMFYSLTRRKLESPGNAYPPSLGGYYSPIINFGEHQNKGFELVLTHNNKIGDFNYNVRGNLSWARNKILKINENTNVPDARRLVGKPMGQYFGFVSDGLFQTEEEIAQSAVFGPTLPGDIKLVDINGDGRITLEQDMVPIGRSNIPEMMFGFNLSGEYKGFDMNLFFQGAALFDVYLCGTYPVGWVDDTFYTRPFFADGNAPYYLVENAWTPENPNAKYPRLTADLRINGGKYSDWWVKDGTYLRLKTAQIGYTLPVGIVKKAGLEKVRVYASGSNLFTLTGVDYFDPEMPSVNQGYYPQQRIYEFGLNITF